MGGRRHRLRIDDLCALSEVDNHAELGGDDLGSLNQGTYAARYATSLKVRSWMAHVVPNVQWRRAFGSFWPLPVAPGSAVHRMVGPSAPVGRYRPNR